MSLTTLGVSPLHQLARIGLGLLKWGLFPLVLLLGVAASVALHTGVVHAMAAQMGVFALSLVAAWAAQRVIPFDLAWQATSKLERRVDITSWVVLMAVVDPLLKRGLMPLLLSLTVTLAHPNGGLGWFPTALPVPLQVCLAAVIAEFGQYWMHRAAHRQSWLWTVHSMHHSPARVSLANGFRTNPLNMIWHQMAGLFVLMLIGTPETVIQILILLSTVIGVFQHVNADLRFDGWNWILGTADLHRWHHAAKAAQASCNFGQNLMLWDQVFGTYRRARNQAPGAVGIEGFTAKPSGYLAWVLRSTFPR